MAVASRLAVARVSPDGAGRRGRPGLAAGGRRRGGAVAASPPTEEAVQMTEPLTKDHLVAYLVSGCKPKENWRSEDSIRSPPFFFILASMGGSDPSLLVMAFCHDSRGGVVLDVRAVVLLFFSSLRMFEH
jgi:hypothetical protein